MVTRAEKKTNRERERKHQISVSSLVQQSFCNEKMLKLKKRFSFSYKIILENCVKQEHRYTENNTETEKLNQTFFYQTNQEKRKKRTKPSLVFRVMIIFLEVSNNLYCLNRAQKGCTPTMGLSHLTI
jgi:hypothetical protein